jgi:hypothetical protein
MELYLRIRSIRTLPLSARRRQPEFEVRGLEYKKVSAERKQACLTLALRSRQFTRTAAQQNRPQLDRMPEHGARQSRTQTTSQQTRCDPAGAMPGLEVMSARGEREAMSRGKLWDLGIN